MAVTRDEMKGDEGNRRPPTGARVAAVRTRGRKRAGGHHTFKTKKNRDTPPISSNVNSTPRMSLTKYTARHHYRCFLVNAHRATPTLLHSSMLRPFARRAAALATRSRGLRFRRRPISCPSPNEAPLSQPSPLVPCRGASSSTPERCVHEQPTLVR